MDLGLAGKKALVCAASKGLGRGCAEALAREGADVTIVARTEATLRQAAEEMGAAAHRAVRWVACDITTADGRDRALAACPQPDILVNNAGGPPPGDFRDWDRDAWLRALDANMLTPIELIKATVDGMMARKWGRIVNITGKSEPEGLNGAFAAKAAMHSWSKGLSREVGKHGITVNCVPPGRIDSEQIRRNYSPEFRKKESEEDIPVGEYGQPADIANLVAFLSSPLARYITGTVIPVDGGLRRYQF